MKNASLCFCIYKIWQILKHFAGTFCWAQNLKLGGVRTVDIIFLHSRKDCLTKIATFQDGAQNVTNHNFVNTVLWHYLGQSNCENQK